MVTDTGCTVLGHFTVLDKLDVALLEVVIGSVYIHIAILGYKNSLHTTTYLGVPHEPMVLPAQKFYDVYTVTQLLCKK